MKSVREEKNLTGEGNGSQKAEDIINKEYNMEDLKSYLKDRIKFLYEVANADPSEDALSVLGQIHEIKHILNYIEEHEQETEDK